MIWRQDDASSSTFGCLTCWKKCFLASKHAVYRRSGAGIRPRRVEKIALFFTLSSRDICRYFNPSAFVSTVICSASSVMSLAFPRTRWWKCVYVSLIEKYCISDLISIQIKHILRKQWWYFSWVQFFYYNYVNTNSVPWGHWGLGTVIIIIAVNTTRNPTQRKILHTLISCLVTLHYYVSFSFVGWLTIYPHVFQLE